jgi:hypothetical protein
MPFCRGWKDTKLGLATSNVRVTFPIILELGNDGEKPRATFKYDPSWYEEDFQRLVKDNWKHYEDLGEVVGVQFASTLRLVKEKAAQWANERHKTRDCLLRVEKKLELVYSEQFTGNFRQDLLERTTL